MEAVSVRLGDLLEGIPGELRGDDTWHVSGLAYDSRSVRPGYLFHCIQGFVADGHDFAAQARERGAGGLVVERWLDLALPQFKVQDGREALALASAAFFGRPSGRLRLAGVTGTNGKTTTTYFLESIFSASGLRTGVVGTVETRVGDRPLPSARTTPESLDLQDMLSRMLAEGVEAVAMEVSSHGVALRRHLGCEFDALVFTNLSRDHLDFHGSFEQYQGAKETLFADARAHKSRLAVALNLDDPVGRGMAGKARGRVIGYGLAGDCGVSAREIADAPRGLSFKLMLEGRHIPVTLKLNGRFNVYNALGAAAASWGMGLTEEAIAAGLEAVDSVPGRMERVEAGQDFLVFVDYAHTPDALREATLGARSAAGGRVILVFGCGGDRDRGKRALMGRVASELADVAIVTSDNPRSEDPEGIIREILRGTEGARARVEVISDRAQAIRQAICEAGEGDVVLVAGKGHESGQTFADHTLPFDDRQVARKILEELWIRSPSKT